ncbi:hypothetical protein EMCRGX_G008391 [Ephydatia muelleri]
MIHPLLISEIPQEEWKFVSQDEPQQSVLERIEAEKLDKTLTGVHSRNEYDLISHIVQSSGLVHHDPPEGVASGTEDGTGALGLGHDGTQEHGGGVL